MKQCNSQTMIVPLHRGRFVVVHIYIQVFLWNPARICPLGQIFLVINLPIRGQSPKAIFTKIWHGRESQVRTLTPNLTVVGLQAPKAPKFVIVGINLPERGISPQAIFFYKIWPGSGTPRSAPKFHRYRLQPPKLSKLLIFRFLQT